MFYIRERGAWIMNFDFQGPRKLNSFLILFWTGPSIFFRRNLFLQNGIWECWREYDWFFVQRQRRLHTRQYANWDFIEFVAVYVLYHVWKSFFPSCFYCLQLWMKTSACTKGPVLLLINLWAVLSAVFLFQTFLSEDVHRKQTTAPIALALLSYFWQLKLRKMWADDDLFECFGAT